jgi:ubiquinone/menaquinone biosynthesis C-methylase UbiE
MLKNFITEEMKTAVDLGCGTGNDSIALSLNGLAVDGFDLSGDMIKTANENASKYGVKINFYNKSIDNIPVIFHDKYDFAVSLGNSIANVEKKYLLKSFKKIFDILKPGSLFIIQILNFHALKKTNNRIVNITKNPPNVYVRFYDSFSMPMNFNILRFDESNPKDFELLTTTLFPYEKEFLITQIKKAGFKKVSVYSDLNKNKFQKFLSKDLILVAQK